MQDVSSAFVCSQSLRAGRRLAKAEWGDVTWIALDATSTTHVKMSGQVDDRT
jgi:hypothetical protein